MMTRTITETTRWRRDSNCDCRSLAAGVSVFLRGSSSITGLFRSGFVGGGGLGDVDPDRFEDGVNRRILLAVFVGVSQKHIDQVAVVVDEGGLVLQRADLAGRADERPAQNQRRQRADG